VRNQSTAAQPRERMSTHFPIGLRGWRREGQPTGGRRTQRAHNPTGAARGAGHTRTDTNAFLSHTAHTPHFQLLLCASVSERRGFHPKDGASSSSQRPDRARATGGRHARQSSAERHSGADQAMPHAKGCTHGAVRAVLFPPVPCCWVRAVLSRRAL
jgi:hypothetical protein